jgi:4-hydroxy-tetrahydrodipicolinate reductase
MGRAVAETLLARSDAVCAGAFDRDDVAAEGLVSRAEALASADVVIDFTTGSASAALALYCAERGAPALVIGSTGFTPAEDQAVLEAARRLAIVKSGNFSMAVNVLLGLVRQAAAALPSALYDIEVFEAHHRRKLDAPSGTALMLGRAAAEGRGTDLESVAVRGRDGVSSARTQGQIGFSVMRGGGLVGEHQVVFAGDDEILTLSHSARDRGLFARGAVEAAVFAAGRRAGLYDMQDVLGMRLETKNA